MAFDLNEAARGAVQLFEEFRQALETTDDPTQIDPRILVGVKNTLNQSTKALSMAKMTGTSIAINDDIKQSISSVISSLLQQELKLKKLQESTGTDYIGTLKSLGAYMQE